MEWIHVAKIMHRVAESCFLDYSFILTGETDGMRGAVLSRIVERAEILYIPENFENSEKSEKSQLGKVIFCGRDRIFRFVLWKCVRASANWKIEQEAL